MSRITTRFDATSTADDVVAGIDLSGRRAVVTGAASGLGAETARSLLNAGAHVTLAVRDVAAGERVAGDLTASTGSDLVAVGRLDLLDLASVTAFAATYDAPLDLLVNNAGVMAVPDLQRTSAGREIQFATNHLGHFALALALHDVLAAAGRARIVSLSSSGHLASPVHLDDLDFARRPYDPWAAYGQSKTANVLFAVEATRRWSPDGITSNAVMPGGIMTNLQRYVPQAVKDGWLEQERRGQIAMKTPQQGAATTLVAAVSPDFEGVGGRYLEDCREAPLAGPGTPGGTGVNPWALDPAAAAQLWEVSVSLLTEAL